MNETVGKVLEVLVCNDPNSIRSQIVDSVDVDFEGFPGDKHSGLTKLSDSRTKFYPRGTRIRNSRQISLVSKEELDIVKERLEIDRLLPEWMGANLFIEGVPSFTDIKPNTRFFFSSGAVLLVTSDNLPCATMTEEICKYFPDKPDLNSKVINASMNLRGLVAVVELPGKIMKGDELRVVYSKR